MTKNGNRQSEEKGFALVATLSIAVLLSLMALAMLSLATIELRSGKSQGYQQQARDNARLAMMLALGELQKLAGPDQCVTARADILSGSEAKLPVDRNALGVWSTVYSRNGRAWPLIGKRTGEAGGESVYRHQGVYTDLRETESSLMHGDWKRELLKGWLVSRKKHQKVKTSGGLEATSGAGRSERHAEQVELVGRGTLGEAMNDEEFQINRVRVDKIPLQQGGCYGWYVSDENQKASMVLSPPQNILKHRSRLSFQVDKPEAIRNETGEQPYQKYSDYLAGHSVKVVSKKSVGMLALNAEARNALSQAMGADFHNLTTRSVGLFTDPVRGGFKKDLTPLLFAAPRQEKIVFSCPRNESREISGSSSQPYDFGSDFPIIPGPRHAVLGPSFGALRYWGRLQTSLQWDGEVVQAESQNVVKSAMRFRSNGKWPHGVSDGWTYDASVWAAEVPKVQPVMMDARWHYYFSHTDDTDLQSLRTHLIPRVCLWNPYNAQMHVEPLLVLMPNPFWKGTNAFHFYVDEAEARRLKNQWAERGDAIDAWGYKGDYKVRLRGSKGGKGDGLFPDDRYLGFVINACDMAAGECLVFSPWLQAPEFSEQGVQLQKYNAENISHNRLSAEVAQGEDHYFHDYGSCWLEVQCTTAKGKSSWRSLSSHPRFFRELRWSKVIRYQPAWQFLDNFPFVMKSMNQAVNMRAGDLVSGNLKAFPTMQLINMGNGGVRSYPFSSAASWGSNDADPGSGFSGGLATFAEDPRRDAPALHQVGVKLLWLDEGMAEANQPPLRQGGNGSRWNADHLVYHPASIAQWNVRPSLVTRSPSSPCSDAWYMMSCGAWMLQFSPLSPQSLADRASLNASGKYFAKSPLARASGLPDGAQLCALFDLPDPQIGTLSLASLRHAQLSPYSWHPSYIIGHSLADIHAPYEASGQPTLSRISLMGMPSSWDAITGGERENKPSYGPRSAPADSCDLLRVGNSAVIKRVGGHMVSSEHEILAYDIAFEVNQNIWDRFFVSGRRLDSAKLRFTEPVKQRTWNSRYQINRDALALLHYRGGVDPGSLSFGFWNHAYCLKNRAAFNVNSTSVKAWIAVLSGLRGIPRRTASGDIGGEKDSVFTRVQRPRGAARTKRVAVDLSGGWLGGRMLTDAEIKRLAVEIVSLVKQRGPFVSLADFVNRRLAPQSNLSSRSGLVEQAIVNAGLNKNLEKLPYLTSQVNAADNNHKNWRIDPEKQPRSKAWGIPGYLTQSDLLEPLAPVVSVRGDSFSIRCYGEAHDISGRVMAKAYLEVNVERGAEYVLSLGLRQESGSQPGNKATDPALMEDPVTGVLREGSLHALNRRFGRRFKVMSMRWLSPREI